MLGGEFARRWAGPGKTLYLLGRREDRLTALKSELASSGARVETVALDLANDRDIVEFVEMLKRLGVKPSLLINCAGFGMKGAFRDLDVERQLAMIRVNVSAVVSLTHRLMPLMIEGGGGEILNVSSAAAFQPGPLGAIYFSTKAFVNHFSSALRFEARDAGVRISTLCPGPFCAAADLPAARVRPGWLRKYRVKSADEIARTALAGLERNRDLIIPGALNAFLAGVVALLPHRLVLPLVGRVMRGSRR